MEPTIDISPAFVWNRMDAEIGNRIVKHDNTNSAIKYFRNNRQYLSDYAYWFFLSTLWLQKSDATDLLEWKRLFSSDRPDCQRCIMKPSELDYFQKLPDIVTAYRAHRTEETDWIAYTLNIETVIRFAIIQRNPVIAEYEIEKCDLLAYFSRRNEDEVILLDKSKAVFIKNIPITGFNKPGSKYMHKCPFCGKANLKIFMNECPDCGADILWAGKAL